MAAWRDHADPGRGALPQVAEATSDRGAQEHDTGLETSGPGAADEAVRLQRSAGNRTASAALADPLRVGAADDPAERSADELADRVLRRLQPAGAAGSVPATADVHRSTGGGGALAGEFDADGDVAERIRRRTGQGSALPTGVRRSMEQGFGRDLGDVRVHTDSEAASLSDSLGAEAFTHGRDVFFGAGRFAPEDAGGQQLLAHELAHVVQGGPGAQRKVHRKLKGTRQAVTDMAGKASVGQKLTRSDYPKILNKLDDYEARESKVVAKKAFGKGDREWMTKTLNDVLRLIDEWTARHETEASKKAHSDMHWNTTQDTYQTAKQTQDYGAMAAAEEKAQGTEDRRRISALRMLRPRVAVERQELLSPSYFTTAARVDSDLKKDGWSQDNAVGGAMNRLDKVEYSGGKKGFFIKDKANAAEGADVAEATGIDKFDPNQGARSVASSRLAKLFGAKEVVGIDFAVHESATRYKDQSDAKATRKMGVFSEKAEGEEAADFKLVRSEQERVEHGPSAKTVDMNDPELQRGLNVLQMLDYISRQMDRHMHNVYIATDAEGRVTGVTGIDLDLSFGKAANQDGELAAAGHFVGIPQLADAQFRAKVLSVSPAEIRACLDGLLSEGEIAATLERFSHLQKVLRDMDPKKVVQAGGWGGATAKEQMSTPDGNYLGKLSSTTVSPLYDDAADAALAPLSKGGMSVEKRRIEAAVKRLVYTGQLSAGQGLGLLDALVTEVLTNPGLQASREMATGALADENAAKKAARVLADAKKKLLEAGGDQESQTMRVEAQIMAAEVEKQAVAILREAADKEHSAAVDALVTQLSDFAVRIANRQKAAMKPVRRPARRPVPV